MDLIHGDCLEKMKDIPDKSVDFVFLDLPFGQTACKWDIKLDLDALWKQLKRIAKNDKTPFFFSTTTKFGFELIKANEKWFRWDLVWKKNRAAGFLNAYKLPMRKHEMIYCFAKKSPEYDVSSHKTGETKTGSSKGDVYLKEFQSRGQDESYYDKDHTKQVLSDPLPTSDITPPTTEHELVYCFAKKSPEYDVSSHKEYVEDKRGDNGNVVGNDIDTYNKQGKNRVNSKIHKDPLPTSDITPPTPEHELVYCFAKKSPEYDVSSHKEFVEVSENRTKDKCELYKKDRTETHKLYKDPLPTSDITPPTTEHELVYCFAKKSPEYDVSSHKTGEEVVKPASKDDIYLMEHSTGGKECMNKPHKGQVLNEPLPTSDITPPKATLEYETYGRTSGNPLIRTQTKHTDRLPTSDITQPATFDLDESPSSWCEFKNDEKTGHRTAKPVALMEFLLKYWTKPDATVLDPTMGSGSMGIACKKMGRKFIGIEMDADIYKLAQDRINSSDPKAKHSESPSI